MLIANTDIEAKQLIDLYDADPRRVEVVHPGVDLDVFAPARQADARAALGLPPDALVPLFAGRIQPLKAPDVLLRAVALLLERDPALRSRSSYPSSAGRPGTGLEHPESLAQLATRWRLDDVVRFVPPVAQAELADWYAAATVVCVPSYNESFGLVAVEAQATGTPVVAAAVGGLTTVVARRRQRAARRRPRPGDWAGAHAGASITDAARAGLGAGGAVEQAQPFALGRTAERTLEVYAGRPRARCARSWWDECRLSTAFAACRWPGSEHRVRGVADGVFTVEPARGAKLKTPCRLEVGPHALGVHAFVCRNPDENHERRLPLAARAQPQAVRRRVRRRRLGDIYLDGRLPLAAVTADELDRLLGLGADLRRRVVQHDPRARLRLVDPQGVGVAQARGASRPRNLDAFRGWLETDPPG